RQRVHVVASIQSPPGATPRAGPGIRRIHSVDWSDGRCPRSFHGPLQFLPFNLPLESDCEGFGANSARRFGTAPICRWVIRRSTRVVSVSQNALSTLATSFHHAVLVEPA